METNDFIEDLKKLIVERLNEYEGSSIYVSDLANTLFEGENASGSVFYNSWETKEFIKENFELFGELVEYWHNNTGKALNPFLEPEKCHVILLLESAQSILSACEFIDSNWDKRIELTKTNIRKIAKQVMEFDGELF